MEQLSADKAYSARYNYEVGQEVGAEVYIPFKSNAKFNQKGSRMWRKMWHLFNCNEEEFSAQYNKRSNVESTFGAMKAKFGERIRSRKEAAQINELLAMVVAYNITVLIRVAAVLGLEDLGPQVSSAPRC